MVPMTMLFDSLESCSGLERLSLVAPSEASPFKMSSESFTRMMINFCTKLSRLVCLFFVINIPKTHCAKAMKELCRKLEVERPSLSIDFQSSEKPQLQTESSVLPLLHRQALIDFSSRVGALPWGMNSDFL